MQSKGLLKSLGLPALTLLLISPATLALQSDANQPINIEADRAEHHEQSGTTIYNGSVIIIQGTMRINADQVTIYTTAPNTQKIVSIGRPAHIQQQINPNEKLMLGQANIINYDSNTGDVDLRQNAQITKPDGSQLKGDNIQYNLSSQEMTAASEKGRVHMVIPPKTPKEGKNGNS